ncbi:type II secretion system F family protein [Lachnospiraceae bacterium 62-35]
MINFRYRIISPSGTEKRGIIRAVDAAHAIEDLKAGGNTVISIDTSGIWDIQIQLPFFLHVTARDMSVFCRQFVAILSAGVSVIRALEMLIEQTENKSLKKALKETSSCMEKGERLCDSMRRQDKIFPAIFVNMVQAGEESGKLDLAFERMAVHYEKMARIEEITQKTMIYPTILLGASIVVIMILLMYIVPMYSDLFANMGTELPVYTRIVVGLSQLLIEKWLLVLLASAGIVSAYWFFSKSRRGKYILAAAALKLPVLGKVNQKTACARFARNFSTLLTAGIPIIEALDTVAYTIDNILYQDAVRYAREQVSAGSSLAVPLKACGMFPPIVCYMTDIGEETGELGSMLDKVATYYEEEVESSAEKAVAAAEPMIIIFMALIITAVILAVYSPMLAMYQNAGSL